MDFIVTRLRFFSQTAVVLKDSKLTVESLEGSPTSALLMYRLVPANFGAEPIIETSAGVGFKNTSISGKLRSYISES